MRVGSQNGSNSEYSVVAVLFVFPTLALHPGYPIGKLPEFLREVSMQGIENCSVHVSGDFCNGDFASPAGLSHSPGIFGLTAHFPS